MVRRLYAADFFLSVTPKTLVIGQHGHKSFLFWHARDVCQFTVYVAATGHRYLLAIPELNTSPFR